MNKYKFEIQNCIQVEMEAESKDEARVKVIYNIGDYSNEMLEDCCISDGEEI